MTDADTLLYDMDALRYARRVGDALYARLRDAAKERALADGRDLVTLADVRAVGPAVLTDFAGPDDPGEDEE